MWRRFLGSWPTLVASTIVGAPGWLDTWEYWRRTVGDMSAVWQGALIGTGAVLFVVWAGFVVERYWAFLRANGGDIAKAIVGLSVAIGGGGFFAYMIFIKESPNTVWTHPTLTDAEQLRIKAECRMRAVDAVGAGSLAGRPFEREQYGNDCLAAKGFVEVEVSNE